MLTQNLGYPRIGAFRELKKACEAYWAGNITEKELLLAGRQERLKNFKVQLKAEIDLIPCNDFSFYDQVLDMSVMLGVIPDRFHPLVNKLSQLDLYFAMCRGYQDNEVDVTAMEMTKWFNTNYHYIVPEFKANQEFVMNSSKLIDEFIEAKNSGITNPKPVLIGPVSFLLLGKEKESVFNRLELVNRLMPAYIQLLKELESMGCEYVQLDEPFLVTGLNTNVISVYNYAYHEIKKNCPQLKVILATYFDDLGKNLVPTVNLPVYALHIDLAESPGQLDEVLANLPENIILSLGLVDGRNIWRNNFEESIRIIEKAIKKIGNDRVWLAPSCSLLHCPYDLQNETNENTLPLDVKSWMAFAKQKLNEIKALKYIKSNLEYDDNFTELVNNSKILAERAASKCIHNFEVKKKVSELEQLSISRKSPFNQRLEKQNSKFGFGLFPTTTIGSFPQTKEIRLKRREYKQGNISLEEYEKFLEEETEKTIRWQEGIGLDVLVHGEFERNDMVEYFGELLNGFAFTENGWVQSYGSRGVKPPVIYGDVSRKKAMTVKWSTYAQSLTNKKVKGMLTGPVTILQWSFVRNDQPRKITAFQIANALCEEVLDLERAGIDIIQIDEPAIREGLPLKKKDWEEYLDWAVKAFRICSWGVNDETQIHTHMCYSEFNDIIEAIAAMDADVISIETSRSHMELLQVFKDFRYPNQIGPGVYDIHSPRIPNKQEMEELLREAEKYIPLENLWVNPDCGLKTRNWIEVKPALENMVRAASFLREQVKVSV